MVQDAGYGWQWDRVSKIQGLLLQRRCGRLACGHEVGKPLAWPKGERETTSLSGGPRQGRGSRRTKGWERFRRTPSESETGRIGEK